MSRDSDFELFSLSLLGALDGEEALAVRTRIEARRPEDLDAIVAAEALFGTIGASALGVTPPPGARDRLLARIAHDAPEVRSRAGSASTVAPRPATPAAAPRRTRWIVPVVLGAAFLGLAVLNVIQSSRPSATTVESEIASILLDPSASRWVMNDAKDPAAKPLGIVVSDAAQKRLYFVADRLAPPPKDRWFVLWTISKEPGAAPKNVGSVRNSSEAKVILELTAAPALRELAVVAVSVETDPKISAPTVVVGAAKAPGGG